MLCAITFQNGQVHFQSKFVNSKHRQEEAAEKKLLYHGLMGTKPSYSMIKSLGTLLSTWKIPPIKFRNPSNTNSFYWGGKVLLLVIAIFTGSVGSVISQTLDFFDLPIKPGSHMPLTYLRHSRWYMPEILLSLNIFVYHQHSRNTAQVPAKLNSSQLRMHAKQGSDCFRTVRLFPDSTY